MSRIVHSLIIIICLVMTSMVSARDLPDFTPLVEKNSAAVVNISTSSKGMQLDGMSPHGHNMPDIPENSPFYEFFKKYFGDIPDGQGP